MAVWRNVAFVFILSIFSLQHHFIRCAASDAQLSVDDIIFVVLSQPNTYHLKRANLFQEELKKQVKKISNTSPTLYFSHKEVKQGGWTIVPILEKIAADKSRKSWVLVCEEETRVDVALLIQNLKKYDHREKIYLGQGLVDKSSTIIHHYKDPGKFRYPDTAAGVVFSMALVDGMAERRYDKGGFQIDIKHELAMYFYDDGKGVSLTPVDFLCAGRDTGHCATTYTTFFPQCGDAIPEEDLFVAVKTCAHYHSTRIPVVKETWGKETQYLEYYSHEEDPDIPTIDLGVPNTERGHCGKTEAIIKRAASHPNIKNRKWLLIADDDTIISLKRLRALLACYNPQEFVALGERYGYSAMDMGYDYITGGGGMVFSMALVSQLAEEFRCRADNNPDDMLLGMRLRHMDVPLTHSPLFHQARPDDYSKGYLSHQIPVSFHKHWQADPLRIFKEWLTDDVKQGQRDKLDDEL